MNRFLNLLSDLPADLTTFTSSSSVEGSEVVVLSMIMGGLTSISEIWDFGLCIFGVTMPALEVTFFLEFGVSTINHSFRRDGN